MRTTGASLPSVAFVGRSVELGESRAALTEALGGSSRAVLITGEPGIGKTALASRLAGEEAFVQAADLSRRSGRPSLLVGAPLVVQDIGDPEVNACVLQAVDRRESRPAHPDVRAEVTKLRSRGVTVEDYDLPGLKTQDGQAR
jgi:AAA ATPase domain